MDTPNGYLNPELEAIALLEHTPSKACWCIRPKGCLGTCGWINGKAWKAVYIKAKTPEKAILKAENRVWK